MKNTKSVMKRIAAVAAVTALVLTSAGCTSKKTGDSAAKTGDKKVKVGITQIADHPSLDNCRTGFIKGLANMGYVEGQNLEIEFKSAQNDMSTATQIAQNFASSGKNLVCGIATPSAQALYASCKDKNIPVIFNAVSDPVKSNLSVSAEENFPGITGVSDELPVQAQLDLIRKMMPDAKKIGILYTTSEDNSVSTLAKYEQLAVSCGFEIISKGISNEADIPQALDILLQDVDCISNMTDNTVVANLAILLEKANDKKIPVFGSEQEQVKNGCIACAGLDYVQLGVQAGEMAGKVLKGEDISNIHFETLKESKNFVNKTVAEALGITVPGDLTVEAVD